MNTSSAINAAYSHCLQQAKSHYENFPVASVLLPSELRSPISAIYAFARSADDFADEGVLSQQQRLDALDSYSECLQKISLNNYQGNEPVFIALQHTVRSFNLPVQLFEDLLIAFRQDVLKSRYQNFNEVLDYCRFSANPVGRLLLYLQGQPSAEQLSQSDAICSSLQLINFYQDITQDYTEQDRVYIPQDELQAAGIAEADLLNPDTRRIAPLLRSLYQRTQQIMNSGVGLGLSINGRLGWEIRAMTLGGVTTLSRLRAQPDQALLSRPRLSRMTLLKLLLCSATPSFYRRALSKQQT